jgi:hypothetical protein
MALHMAVEDLAFLTFCKDVLYLRSLFVHFGKSKSLRTPTDVEAVQLQPVGRASLALRSHDEQCPRFMGSCSSLEASQSAGKT